MVQVGISPLGNEGFLAQQAQEVAGVACAGCTVWPELVRCHHVAIGIGWSRGRCSGIAATCNLRLVVVVVFAVGVLVLVVQHVLLVVVVSDVVHGVVFVGPLCDSVVV